MTLTAYRLFSGITMVGMSGVDTFEYWKYAKELIEGRADFIFDRLSFYALNMLALETLGINDYAIRAFIGAAQIANLALVYLLALRISRNPLVALSAAALYALNPVIISYAATELPHIYSVTFVLLAAHCAVWAIADGSPAGIRLIAAAAAGFFAAGAFLTHEDLILLAVGLGCALVLIVPNRGLSVSRVTGSTVVGTAFAGGFFSGLLWPMLVTGVGPSKLIADFFAVRAMMDANTLLRTGGAVFLTTAPRIFQNLAEFIGQPLFAVTLFVMVAAPLFQLWRRSERLREPLALEAMAVSHIALLVCIGRVYLEGSYNRVFLPAVALLLVFSLCSGYALARFALTHVMTGRNAQAVTTMLCVMVAAATLLAYQPQVYAAPPLSPHRKVYDAVKDLVTVKGKLLLPACFAPAEDFSLQVDWVGIGSEVYLGPNAVSVYLARELEPFEKLIGEHSIRFVLVADTYIRGMMSRERVEETFAIVYGVPLPPDTRDSLDVAPQQIWPGEMRVIWSQPACSFETKVLRRLLLERHAQVVARVPDVGEVYELPRDKAAGQTLKD